LLDILTSDNLEAELDYCREELFELKYWLSAERFDRHAVNRRLSAGVAVSNFPRQYALGDEAWQW
jgi:hypothetical protein